MEQLQGIICNLERFATHDGPGIRTTVFTKGCPLNCVWCSSPHTRNQSPEILYSENRCGRSGACAKTCPEDALKLSDEGLQIDRDLCTTCGDCIEVCTSRALEITGESMTVEELFREVDKDSSFYRRSSGGVTVSGGELTMQSEFVLAKACLPHLRAQGGGRMLFTSSVTGNHVAVPGNAHYAASKSGLNGFIRAAAIEFAGEGITVNGVEPGLILTPALDSLATEEQQQGLAQFIPMKRLGQPEDIAHAMLYLASAEAGYVTGQTIVVDGGALLPENGAMMLAE